MGMIPSKKVFVSSTTQDLYQYREEATKLINKLSNDYKNRFQLVEVTMDTEALDGERKPAVDRSKGWVDSSDWIVLIVAWNYGYVPPSEECSVTEWEYRQAEKGSKPCFIFLAGENDDGEKQYWPIKGREKENLANWNQREKSPEDHAEMLKQLKKKLRKTDFKIFSDLDDFLEQLEGSLKKRIDLELKLALQEAIDTQPKPIPLESFLELILDLQDPIQKCILKVNRLGVYKNIHDQLHQIRQYVIRPLREGILPQWEEQETLSRENERLLNRRIFDGGRLQGSIKKMMDNLGVENSSLFAKLKIIVDTNLLGEEEVQEPNIEDFEVKLGDFSSFVQSAFTEANTLMQDQADLLNKFNEELLNKINERRIIHHLTVKQNERLDPELNTIAAEKKRFLDVLKTHDNWQKLHDGLEVVDGFKETKSFETRIRQFCSTQSVTFTHEIIAEIQRLQNEDPDNPIQGCIAKLKDDWDEINKSISKETYEAMREKFDDTFYNLDKHTLEEVKKARKCAEEFKLLLETLRVQEQEKQSSL